MTSTHTPCSDRRDAFPRAGWGTVCTSVATTILAPRDQLVALFLDYAEWPRIFSETIAGAELVRRDAHSIVLMVHHRREGRVLNVLTNCGDGIVALREFKQRYNATFVNRFARAHDGTRYSIDAEVRIKRPFSVVAPLLRGVVERALRRYTIEPLRAAAGSERGDDR